MKVSIDRDAILQEIERTGMTQLEFCRRNGIAVKDMKRVLQKGEANALITNKIASGLGVMPGELVKKKYAL